MPKVYVICNRDEPLGVFEIEFVAMMRARDESNVWAQPIRVIEVELNGIKRPRVCATYQEGEAKRDTRFPDDQG